jgi:hypothetical protein
VSARGYAKAIKFAQLKPAGCGIAHAIAFLRCAPQRSRRGVLASSARWALLRQVDLSLDREHARESAQRPQVLFHLVEKPPRVGAVQHVLFAALVPCDENPNRRIGRQHGKESAKLPELPTHTLECCKNGVLARGFVGAARGAEVARQPARVGKKIIETTSGSPWRVLRRVLSSAQRWPGTATPLPANTTDSILNGFVKPLWRLRFRMARGRAALPTGR